MGDRENVSLVEILLIPKHNEKDLEAKRQLLKDKHVEGCTFKPTTLDYPSQQQRESHGDKCIDLYSSKPKGWFKDKEYKTTDAAEYERTSEQCTFKPSINDPSAVQALGSEQVDNIRGVDKVKDRLNKARDTALQKKLMTERGVPA